MAHDCFTQAAGLLLKDAEKGLRVIAGWVELGNTAS